MQQEELKFNNSVLAFMVENKEYLQTKASNGDTRAEELEKENTNLIEWYKRGNTLPFNANNGGPEKKTATRIPPKLKERLRSHEVELVECMLECGFYYPNEVHLSGVQRSLNTIFRIVESNHLEDRTEEVKECIKRVQTMNAIGRVKDKQKYLVKSLMNLKD